jgi:nucleotide sugar dehydrogenase
VGLHCALYFAKSGASVIGADIDENKVELIKQGICPINNVAELFVQVRNMGNFEVTSNITEAVKSSNVHIMCLPTPLGTDRTPDFSALVSAAEAVGQGLKRGDLVILESSVYPGVTNGKVKPVLERSSGLTCNDFGLAYCFERIDPGNTVHRLDNTPKVIGAADGSADIAVAVYSVIIHAPITKVRNCETAEMVKLVENIYRDINIAFVNEMALLCEKLNIDVLEVLGAASSKWNFVPHLPGAGVGGTCIPVNPYYLMKCANNFGTTLKLVKQAREVNEAMPEHMIELVVEALRKICTPIRDARICILGLAYKGDSDDTRGSPTFKIVEGLRELGVHVVCYDPLITQSPPGIDFQRSYELAINGSDCVVIATDHSCFKSLDIANMVRLANSPMAIVDGRNVLVPRQVKALGITYLGIGRNEDSGLNLWNSGLKAQGERATR